MSFAKKFLLLVGFVFLFGKNLFALTMKVDWPEGSYQINNEEVPFKKMLPFSSREVDLKTKPTGLSYYGGVVSPVVGGETLHAVDVIADERSRDIFSAFNLRGATKKGAIQIIHKDGEDLFVNSELLFTDSDINAIYREDEKLYFAGSDANGAFFSYAITRKGKFEKVTPKVYLFGYVATDILRVKNSIYVTTADNGGLYSIFTELDTPDWFYSIFDARSLTASGRNLFVLSGQPAKIYEINRSGQLLNTINVGGALTAESKSFLYKSKDYLFATVGEAGLKVYCDDTLVGQLDSIILPGFDPSKTVTNALAVNNDFVFTASGEAGIYMYEKVTSLKNPVTGCSAVTLNELDYFNFWPEVSANHIALENGLVFVASGAYGIQAFELD